MVPARAQCGPFLDTRIPTRYGAFKLLRKHAHAGPLALLGVDAAARRLGVDCIRVIQDTVRIQL